MEKKIIAVTGNSGKTVFSHYLAKELSRSHKTIFIASDDTKPVCRCLYPPKSKMEPHSLGRLLSLPVIHEQDVFDCSSVVNKNLLMLGYEAGESSRSYPDIVEVNLQNLFRQLQNMAEFIVVDTATMWSEIDAFALGLDNHCEICVTTADVRGMYHRQLWPTGDIKVLWQNSPYNAVQDVLSTFAQEKPFLLPYCKDFGGIYNGVSIGDIQPQKEYQRALQRIVGALI